MKKTFFYPSFFIKVSLLLLFLFHTNAFAKPQDPANLTNSGDTCESKGTGTVSFGISSITKLPDWCSWIQGCPGGCEHEAADDFYKSTPASPIYNLKKLVNEPYEQSNPNNNIKNYWMECGFGSSNFCVDDDMPSMIEKDECLTFQKVPIACTVTFWVQLVSECDRCINVNGTPTLGGTWWKWQKTLAPDQMPGTCNSSYLKSHIQLELQEARTDCKDENTQWGCGVKEVRD